MAQQYVSSVPEDGSLKPGLASFFESFYAVSDTAVAHEQYADHFTSDATLIMASKETKGREGKINGKGNEEYDSLTQHNAQASSKCATACGKKSPRARTNPR
jgi:hypothetical protein